MKFYKIVFGFLTFITLLLHIGYLFFTLEGTAQYLPQLFILWGVQALMIFSIVYLFYEKPLKYLEITIKKFLIGSSKEEDIKVKKTLNSRLNYILLFFSKTIHSLKNIKDEFLHGKEIKSEVELWKEIQEKLLQKTLLSVPELEIIGKSKPAWDIGGDSYDVIQQGNNYYIYVGDATGHGVGAWFIMMMVNALISAYAKVTVKWNHILSLTNDIIKPRVKANLLMSMLLVRWDAENKKLFMTGAGHEYLMVYKHHMQKCFRIKSGWVALGMVKDIHKMLKEQEISFEPNDVLVLYSDGITEAINQGFKDGNERMFGEDLLSQAIEAAPGFWISQVKTARSIFKNITIELSKFMGYKHVQLDDITLVTIQYISPDYDKNQDCDENASDEFITEWNWKK